MKLTKPVISFEQYRLVNKFYIGCVKGYYLLYFDIISPRSSELFLCSASFLALTLDSCLSFTFKC